MENQLSKQQSNEVGITKFKDFTEENPHAELLRFIDGLCFKLSLPPLEEGQVIYIAKFLVKEFKWATMEDIDNAILKAKAGKLKQLNSSDYNKLSIDYLGRVLTAYRTYKAENKLIACTNTESNTKALPDNGNEPVVAYNHIKAIFLDKKGGEYQFPDIMLADWTICYHYLIETGKMIEQSLEDKVEFAEIVREDLLEELKENRIDTNALAYKIKTEKATNKYAVASECIRRLVRAWFLTNKDKL